MKKSRSADVAVWGRVPPPMGGMAVHLMRLLPFLEDAGISVRMFSVGRRTSDHPDVGQVSKHRIIWFLGHLFCQREPLHYVLSGSSWARFAASLIATCGRGKVILRIGESLERIRNEKGSLEYYMIKFALSHVDAVVAVNAEIAKTAEALGARRVLHIPGFIPELSCPVDLPLKVVDFLSQGDGPVLLASGEVRDPRHSGDLYGAYFLLDLIDKLPDIRLVFYAYSFSGNDGAEDRLCKEIIDRRLARRFLLYRSEGSIMPMMSRSAIFVRPTLTDGDSSVVREALHARLPVVASDCSPRPAEVITYKTGDLVALQESIEMVLGDRDSYIPSIHHLSGPNNAEKIAGLMAELLGKR